MVVQCHSTIYICCKLLLWASIYYWGNCLRVFMNFHELAFFKRRTSRIQTKFDWHNHSRPPHNNLRFWYERETRNLDIEKERSNSSQTGHCSDVSLDTILGWLQISWTYLEEISKGGEIENKQVFKVSWILHGQNTRGIL